MVQPLQLPIKLTSPIQHRRPSSHPQTSTPSSSSSSSSRVRLRLQVQVRVRVRVRPTNRRRNYHLCTSTTPASRHCYPIPRLLYNVQGQLHRHLRHTWPPHSHRPAPSLQTLPHTLAVPGSVCVVWWIDDWECYFGCKFQYQQA